MTHWQISHEMQVKIADGAAATSGLLWMSAKAAEWGPILQDISFVVAIIAGLVAIGYHIHNWEKRK